MRRSEDVSSPSSDQSGSSFAPAQCLVGAVLRRPLLIASIFFSAASWGGVSAQTDVRLPDPIVAPSEVIRRMVEQNQLRAQHLKYFTSRRSYRVEFHGLGRSLVAQMHVQATYSSANGKSFQVIDESGSRVLLNHVLKKLLETEQEDSRHRTTELTPLNYNFVFLAKTTEGGRELYIFSVEPKSKNKLLYRGRIWVDDEDFAVVRVDAQPAESPSFWIRSTQIHHTYAKNGEFWLPEQNISESKIRLGGTARLTINYGTYEFQEPQQLEPVASADIPAQ
jgi:hypothetical protein